ncbi:LolA family protein [Candidatus Contubernalis alkaliaceticus]|uniref:LolA family protein n=1 Tax=Candidatus Contubernalis alkaliaceticus TaxID=338645 RepID=UPI001F4BE4F4|nr:hypothetical protein [Candidatus Contubernalis alkalaceticus]UNC93446.1 hypothetical protein HUE98_16000 [Candidatus Contubernalis alkalaceticus]
MDKEKQEEILSEFIDDLTAEKKPRAYESDENLEMEKLFETLRAVKRTGEVGQEKIGPGEDSHIQSRRSWVSGKPRNDIRTGGAKQVIRRLALMAAAAVIVLAAFIGIMDSPFMGQESIVEAVVRAYGGLESYAGVVEIRSEREGIVDFQETVNITYRKPWSYVAVHHFDNVEVTNISDGERLVTIMPNSITVENVFPEKELWRYHIGSQVWELKNAVEVTEIGEEILLGRETVVLQYRYEEGEEYSRMWIDKGTNLPLKKELIPYEGSSLVVEFTELKVNPPIDPQTFDFALEDIDTTSPEQPYVQEINRLGEMSEVEANVELEALKDHLPQGYELFKVGVLENDKLFDYVLRYRGQTEKEFLDIYLSSNPEEFYYSPDSRVGKLAGGYVEVNRKAWNVFELYIGESSIAKWITPEFKVFMAAPHGSGLPAAYLEKIAGEEIDYVTPGDLAKEGIDQPIVKEGH